MPKTVYLTTGDIAERLFCTPAQVQYAIQKAKIKEDGRAGIIRLFDVDRLDQITNALRGVRFKKRRRRVEPNPTPGCEQTCE